VLDSRVAGRQPVLLAVVVVCLHLPQRLDGGSADWACSSTG
jgi:hypothetical protein